MSEETETTNKVLETKIDGLSKLTDERFASIKETLLRIESSTRNFVTKIELDETKKDFLATIGRIENWQTHHEESDNRNFTSISNGQEKMKDIMLKWIGGLAVIGFILSFASPFILKYWFHI